MSGSVRIKNIACAAWMRWQGLRLLKITPSGEFEFDNTANKSAGEWLREYQETDFYRVDSNLLALRDLLSHSK